MVLVALLALAGAVFVAAAIPGAQARVGGSASGPLIALATDDDVQDIAVVRPDGSGFRNLTKHPAGGSLPFWTRNGWLVYLPHWRVRPNGTGRGRLRADFELGDAVSFDGRLIASTCVIVDLRGRVVRNLCPRLRGCFHVVQAVWSPDGRYLALNAWRCDDEQLRTLIVRTDGKQPARVLARRGHEVEAWSFSRDGRRLLVYVDPRTPSSQAWVISVRTGARRRLLGGIAWARAADWSPDGRRLAYIGGNGGLYVVRATGGRGRRLARTASLQAGVAWSPRGGRIAYCDRTGLHLVRVASGRAVTLTRLCSRTTPSWEPRGRALTFSSPVQEIFTVSVPAGRLRRVVGRAVDAHGPMWAPDRRHVAFTRGPQRMTKESTLGVYVVRPNGAGLRRLGRGYAQGWAPDSRHLVYVNPSGRIMVAGLDGATKQVATGTAPVWSPDGRKIAFMRYSLSKTESDVFERGSVVGSTLFLVGADGSGEQVLAQSAEWGDAQFSPAWSPDGSAIAVHERLFDETSEENPLSYRIVLVDSRTGAVRPLAPVKTCCWPLRWSPDSRRILVSEPKNVRVLDVAAGSFRTLAKPGSGWDIRSPVWSPDGKRVAYLRYKEGDVATFSDLWIVRQDGTARRRVLKTSAVEQWLAWAPAVRPLPPNKPNGG